MSPFRLLAIVLLLCGTLSAEEEKQPLTLEQLEAIAIQPAKHYEETNSRVVPEMLPLFKAETIVYTGKNKYKETEIGYRLHVPENREPDKKYPLILWLHGAGEVGNDNQLQLIHLHHIITYLTGPKARDFFLLVPQAPRDHAGWDAHAYYSYDTPDTRVFGFRVGNAQPKMTEEPFEDSPLGFSLAMLDQVIENYPVDTDRITVSGLSTGGDGTWRALERRPEQFAAAVPLVSWVALKADAIEKHPALKKVPIWAIYSSDDNGIDEARSDFARVEATGCNVKKTEFGLCGHNGWTPAMLQGDIFSWLLSRSKKDGEYVAVTDANVNPDEMKGIVEVALRAPGGTPKLAPEAPAVPPPPVALEEGPPLITMEPEIWQELQRRRAERAQAAQVPEPPVAVVEETRRRRPSGVTVELPVVPELPVAVGHIAQMNRTLIDESPQGIPLQFIDRSAVQEAQDVLYALLVHRFIEAKDGESFKRVLGKLSLERKKRVLSEVLQSGVMMQPEPMITLKEIETLIDELITEPGTMITEPGPVVPANSGDTVPGSLPGSKIVEDCDREWAMTSESLYGMFPADWGKEGQRLPDFVVKSTAEEFERALRDDSEKLELVCKSILALEHRPMSSPWFETSGGRLRSDIKYTLSAKGETLVGILKESDNAQAKRTLEKIETLLEQ